MQGGAKLFSSSLPAPIRPANGLVNIGNSCFLNSILQSFSSLKDVHIYLSKETHLEFFRAMKTRNSTLSYSLQRTIQGLSLHSEKAFIPPVVENGPLKKKFLNTEQQDAHELMQFIMSLVSEESERRAHIPMVLSTLTAETRPLFFLSLASGLKGDANSSWNLSGETNPFVGLLQGTLKCEHCKTTFEPTYQKFCDLSLSIPHDRPTLEQCLGEFSKPELVTGITCEKCGPKKQATKQLTIASPPRTLCLHLRRLVTNSYGMLEKLHTHVEFPRQLDLKPFCTDFTTAEPHSSAESFFKTTLPFAGLGGGDHASALHPTYNPFSTYRNGNSTRLEEKPSKHSLLYNLSSVIVHSGNHRGGHYTVFRRAPTIFQNEKEYEAKLEELDEDSPKNGEHKTQEVSDQHGEDGEEEEEGDEEWVHISDETSRPVQFSEVRASQAYMLYYEKATPEQ